MQKKTIKLRRNVAQRTNDVAARLDGEEFATILPNVDEMALHNLCDKIHRAFAALAIEHSSSLIGDALTVSIGCVLCAPQGDSTPSKTYQQADEALYLAKE